MPREKFTYEKHQEKMREILTPPAPIDRAGVLGSLLERVRGRGTAPTPRLPRLPKLPREKL